ncbi:hypothetical protein DL765_009837 [Monosporascus sp. GIB2]|nr:hypothetical protein DL765_009837 [Monosporascus sp. GIB2]
MEWLFGVDDPLPPADKKPDISLPSQAEVDHYCADLTRGSEGGGGIYLETEVISRYFLSEVWAASFLEREGRSTSPLMKAWPAFEGEDDLPRLIEEYDVRPPMSNAMGLADHIYQGVSFSFTSRMIAAYMDLAAHKNSGIRIIEVSGGTGSSTGLVLEAYPARANTRVPLRDTITTTSPASLPASSPKPRNDTWTRQAVCNSTLNVERDPVEQGFAAVSRDVAIGVARQPASSFAAYKPCLGNDSLRLLPLPGWRLSTQEDLAALLQEHTNARFDDLCDIESINSFISIASVYDKCICLCVRIKVQPGPLMKETVLRVTDLIRTILADKQEADLREEDIRLHTKEPEPTNIEGRPDIGGGEPPELRFSPGRLDSFQFGQDASAPLPRQGDEMSVLVKTTGIDFKDVMAALNRVSGDYIGQEFSGLSPTPVPGPKSPSVPATRCVA